MLTRENFFKDWCRVLGGGRALTPANVIEYVNVREGELREKSALVAMLDADEREARAMKAETEGFDEILVGDTVYVRAGGFRVHAPSGRNLRVYLEEGNPLTQVAELKVDTTDSLIAELDWCIEEGQSGPRTRAALKAAREVLDESKTTALNWSNGCDESVPAALRYLADYPRPVGGEQSYNAEHLYQLAGEIEATARRSRAPAAAIANGAPRKPVAGALYQVGTRVINGMLWADVDYALYTEKSARGERNLRIVFANPVPGITPALATSLSSLGDQHRFAARMAQMGACSCLTKTPDIQYHAKDCKYRLFAEIERALGGAGEAVQPAQMPGPAEDDELLRRVWKSVNALPYMEGMTTEFARQVLRAYRLSLQLPEPLAFYLELRRAARKAPLGCTTAEEIDTLIASSMQGAEAAQGDVPLVYRQYHCLHEWAENDDFWEKQPYGNRFYFGEGTFDYVPRDVLRAFVQRFGLAPSRSDAQG